MKIFWAWQSDTHGKIGRFFVRDALNEAIEKIKQKLDVEEPLERERREALHLDHDRKNVRGSPGLADVILRKIDASNIFLADVTLVGQVIAQNDEVKSNKQKDKKFINSNVAIELGYAIKSLSEEGVLMIYNQHYGSIEELPFDIRHKTGIIPFNLAPSANSQQIKEAQKLLVSMFVKIIEAYIDSPTKEKKNVEFLEVPTTYNEAVYFLENENVANVGGFHKDANQFCFNLDLPRLGYIRIIPSYRLDEPIPLTHLNQIGNSAYLLSNSQGGFCRLNKYGVIKFNPYSPPPSAGEKGFIESATQLFQNGEIWSISSDIIMQEKKDRPDWVYIPSVGFSHFETIFSKTLKNNLKFAINELGLKFPLQIELGFIGLENVGIYIDQRNMWGPIYADKVIYKQNINSQDTQEIEKILIGFFEKVFDTTGYPRPKRDLVA